MSRQCAPRRGAAPKQLHILQQVTTVDSILRGRVCCCGGLPSPPGWAVIPGVGVWRRAGCWPARAASAARPGRPIDEIWCSLCCWYPAVLLIPLLLLALALALDEGFASRCPHQTCVDERPQNLLRNSHFGDHRGSAVWVMPVIVVTPCQLSLPRRWCSPTAHPPVHDTLFLRVTACSMPRTMSGVAAAPLDQRLLLLLLLARHLLMNLLHLLLDAAAPPAIGACGGDAQAAAGRDCSVVMVERRGPAVSCCCWWMAVSDNGSGSSESSADATPSAAGLASLLR